MTPPVRPTPEWTDPDAHTLADALVLAEHSALAMSEAHTVCLMIDQGKVGYRVLQSASYATLREQGHARHLAAVASVLPTGRTEVYDSILAPVAADDVRGALAELVRRSQTRHLFPGTR